MSKCPFHDAFSSPRKEKGYFDIEDQGDPVKMILRHKDVRRTAHNYETFQSGAQPGRIVVPSEVNIRTTRQIPFEVDPPLHGEYRSLLESWFRRPLTEEYELRLEELISEMIDEALTKKEVEVVNDFSLPLQSKALTFLLNTPMKESLKWISWGVHVFRNDDNPLDSDKASVLYDYIDAQLEKASKSPNDDLYSVLLNSDFQGRKLTFEEAKGVMILTFAGGRDTVINAVTNTIAYFSDHPESLEQLRLEPESITTAVEELVRYFSPLTHMGRVVTEDTDLCGSEIKEDTRVSLCWASANRDESVFERPNDVILDRKINPHVAFGFSHHKCLGAHHARQILKVLLKTLTLKVKSISLHQKEDKLEEWGEIKRKVGYEKIVVRFNKRNI